MIRIFKYFNRKQWLYVPTAVLFIVIQVWLDLKLPDYMSGITTLVQTEGSSMSDILTQGGYMLMCALGSMVASIVVGYFAARVAAGLAQTLRNLVYDKTMDFSMEEIDRFSTASLINRTTNDVTQIQNLVVMGLQAIMKAPIMVVWAVVKISGKSWQWEYKQEELHNRIGYISQKAVLFSGTVSSNVAYGERENEIVSEEEIKKAVEISQGTDFVEKMEGAYDAPIAQGGTNVSGGQKQRLSIARAVTRSRKS